jgi:hypothetical protein
VANLLHRILRRRPPAEELEPEEAATAPAPEPATEETRQDPSVFEARPKPGRGRRKTQDEVSSLGPGEPD